MPLTTAWHIPCTAVFAFESGCDRILTCGKMKFSESRKFNFCSQLFRVFLTEKLSFSIHFWFPFLTPKKGPTFRSDFREALGTCNFCNEKWDHFLIPKVGTKNRTKIKQQVHANYKKKCIKTHFGGHRLVPLA